jgi:uncharacterized membrane protein
VNSFQGKPLKSTGYLNHYHYNGEVVSSVNPPRIKVPIAIWIGLFAFFLVLFLNYLQGIDTTRYPDAPLFIDQALGILNGWDFMKSNSLLFLSPLGFTSTLAGSFYISQSTSILLFKVLLAATHGLSTYLVAIIGKSMGMSRRFWLLAAFCFSLDPFLLVSAIDIQVETFVTFFVLFWGYLFMVEAKNHYQLYFQTIAFGLSGFIAITFRPNILIPFALLTIFLFYSWRRETFRWKLIANTLLSFLTPLAIFEVIISKLYGGFVFLAANGGLNTVLTCKAQFLSQYTGLISSVTNREVNRTYYAELQAIKSDILLQNPNISFSDFNQEYLKIGLDTCFENPIQSGFVVLVKSIALWRPFTVIGAYGISISLLSLLIWLPLSLATIWVLIRKNSLKGVRIMSKYFVILAVGFTISLVPSSTQIRHRVAFAEPFYWLFGVYALSITMIHLKNRKMNSRK